MASYGVLSVQPTRDHAAPLLPATTAVSQEAPARLPESLMPARQPNLRMGAARRPARRVAAVAGRLRAGAQPVRAGLPTARRSWATRRTWTSSGPAARRAGRDLTDLVLHAPDRRRSRAAAGRATTRPARRHGERRGRTDPWSGDAGPRDRRAGVRRRDRGDAILDKHVYLMHATFPSNVDRVTLTPGEADLALPVTPTQVGRGLHHPRWLPAHAGPVGAEQATSQAVRRPSRPSGSRPMALRTAVWTSRGCASTACSTDFILLRSS